MLLPAPVVQISVIIMYAYNFQFNDFIYILFAFTWNFRFLDIMYNEKILIDFLID